MIFQKAVQLVVHTALKIDVVLHGKPFRIKLACKQDLIHYEKNKTPN